MDEHADLRAVDETPHTLHPRHTLHSAIKYSLTQVLTYDKSPIQQKNTVLHKTNQIRKQNKLKQNKLKREETTPHSSERHHPPAPHTQDYGTNELFVRALLEAESQDQVNVNKKMGPTQARTSLENVSGEDEKWFIA